MANKISIEIKKLDEGDMYLHEQLASGKLGLHEFIVERTLPNSSIIVQVGKFEDHHRYIISLNDITHAMLTYHIDGGGQDIKAKPRKTIKKPK